MAPDSTMYQDNNPFMTLVDAATSLLDKSSVQPQTAESTDSTTNSVASTGTVASLDDEGSDSSSSKKPRESFAKTLMTMLLDERYAKVVTFLPDDQSFGIINAKKFCDEVMPEVFGIRTFSSFVRKLTRWGFERIMEKKTHDVDVFRHNLFRKGDWKLCAKIKCVGRLAKSSAAVSARQPKLSLPQSTPIVNEANLLSTTTSKPASLRAPTFIQSQALRDVTSQVVGAALDTLHRDKKVQLQKARTPMSSLQMQQLLARQQVRAQMMLLRQRQIPRTPLVASPRSSMAFL